MPHRLMPALLLLAWTLCGGCAFWQPPVAPMRTSHYVEPGRANRTLFVLLPGIGDKASDFVRQGFIAEVRERGLPVDIVTVDAHFGYYLPQTLVERLRSDVVAKARRQGYERIWLVGISLGGLGSLLYAKHFPHDIAGVIVLAPYLGENELIAEIRAAGGPAHWHPQPLADFRRRVWSYLAGFEQAPERMPRVILAYGLQDRYAAGQELLAELLPADQVLARPGRHRWSTWRALWDEVLDQVWSDGETVLALSEPMQSGRP